MSGASEREQPARRAVLVTGAAGYVGRLVVDALARDRRGQQTIVATDLRDVPAGVKVRAGRLALRANSAVYPFKSITVEIHELTQANADWIEGDNSGTRVPSPGTPCWNFRKHGAAKWAGKPGAMEPGADFSTAWSGRAECPAKAQQWVELKIPAEAVQRWIDRPETNCGLHIYPADATEKGRVFGCASSDCV